MKKNNKQYHFILVYDSEEDYWEHGVEVEEAKFQYKTIWNKDSGQWECGYLGNGEYEENEMEAVHLINKLIDYANENFRRKNEQVQGLHGVL